MASSMSPGNLPQSVPDSLQDLCIFYCTNNLDIVMSHLNSLKGQMDDVSSTFSLLLGNKMLEYYLRCHVQDDMDTNENFRILLQSNQHCNSLCLKRRGLLSLENVTELANNPIKCLDLVCFDEYTDVKGGFESLVKNNLNNLTSVKLTSKTLQTDFEGLLKLLCGIKMYPKVGSEGKSCDDEDDHQHSSDSGKQSGSENRIHCAPNLKSFAFIQCYGISAYLNIQTFELPVLLQVIEKNIQLQRISIVSTKSCINLLSSGLTAQLRNLQSLVLSGINLRVDEAATNKYLFANLPALKQLRHLDLSCDCEGDVSHLLLYSDDEVSTFIQAVKDMPQLKSLDIAGTNLSEIVGHKDKLDTVCKDHCMPGFEGRNFEYIGLFNCDVILHKCIPALKVSGTGDEDQLLVALWSYHHNSTIMSRVLDELQLQINALPGIIKNPTPFIEGCFAYLEEIADWDLGYYEAKHVEHKNVDSCLMNIYNLGKSESLTSVTVKQKRMRLERLLVICDNSVRDLNDGYKSAHYQSHILRVAIVLLSTMNMEQVAVHSFLYEQYVQALVNIVLSEADEHSKKISRRLIHSACRVSQDHKARAGGKVRLVQILLREVQSMLSEGAGITEQFEKIWSILWTLTDEVASNCELFLKYSGSEIVKTCFEKFPNEHDLQRKISGAMSNVSENAHLRPLLMTVDLITIFRSMLKYDNNEGGYDISSHAAGFLVLMASDGPQAWVIQEPSRDDILDEVEKTIGKWDIYKSKGVRFRSLTPMLDQIENFSTPVAQYWGAWMICNLVIVKAKEYCDMLISENGLAILDRTLQHGGLQPDLVSLLQQIREITLIFKRECEEYNDGGDGDH